MPRVSSSSRRLRLLVTLLLLLPASMVPSLQGREPTRSSPSGISRASRHPAQEVWRERFLALEQALELRDPATAAHCRRTGALAALLAPALDVDPVEAELAGRLHDLGKLAMPDSILRGRTSELSPRQRSRVELHPVHGRRLALRLALPDFLVEAIGGHHERFDGSGYPEGLVGEAIPAMARLVAVADVIDAMTSRRSYKAPLPFDRVMGVLIEGRGRLFDPRVVDSAQARRSRLETLLKSLGPRHGKVH